MKRLTLLLFAVLVPMVGYVVGYASAQQQVDRKGVASIVKVDQVMSGYLTELNGKYKLIVTEITFEPGGNIAEHHHVGPGIRFVASGELTLVGEGKTRTYKTGEYFYESGDVTTAAYNKTTSPVRIINFEILPADWKGGSAVPPKSK
ncbi:MAG: cupin [candidate division NC10 bacterium CSP1-5]|nr:MAG: cupin [candidate division NC10 bacterium CSP1-5]